jgi:hypothetical protein
MIGLKRFAYPGLIISAAAHIGALVVGLLYFNAGSLNAIPPEAMVVDIVPPDEAPRLQGVPSELRTSGAEVSSNSKSASVPTQPPPKPAAPQQQQSQQRSQSPRNAHQAVERPQNAGQDAAQSETAQAQSSDAPPAPPQPHSQDTPYQPGVGEMLAQLALIGGPLGGGFNAPQVNALQIGYDFTEPFRERVSWCSSLPAGLEAGDKISVSLRVYLNRDGTLASTPKLLGPSPSPKAQVLMQSAIDALRKCQPYTMLPAEKYQQWKTLDLVFYPLNFLGR